MFDCGLLVDVHAERPPREARVLRLNRVKARSVFMNTLQELLYTAVATEQKMRLPRFTQERDITAGLDTTELNDAGEEAGDCLVNSYRRSNRSTETASPPGAPGPDEPLGRWCGGGMGSILGPLSVRMT